LKARFNEKLQEDGRKPSEALRTYIEVYLRLREVLAPEEVEDLRRVL